MYIYIQKHLLYIPIRTEQILTDQYITDKHANLFLSHPAKKSTKTADTVASSIFIELYV